MKLNFLTSSHHLQRSKLIKSQDHHFIISLAGIIDRRQIIQFKYISYCYWQCSSVGCCGNGSGLTKEIRLC